MAGIWVRLWLWELEEIEVDSEAQIEAVTALSGSGPAYVFYFLQSLIKGGIALGLPLEIAKKLAIKTVMGAANLATVSPNSLDTFYISDK